MARFFEHGFLSVVFRGALLRTSAGAFCKTPLHPKTFILGCFLKEQPRNFFGGVKIPQTPKTFIFLRLTLIKRIFLFGLFCFSSGFFFQCSPHKSDGSHESFYSLIMLWRISLSEAKAILSRRGRHTREG